MPKTTLRIPTPCPESWAAMTPTGSGRHCAACQQVVVDFTQKTDAEILAILAGAGGTPCGRFRADQLARPLLLPTAPSRWRAWLGAVLTAGGLLSAGRTAAQTNAAYNPGPLPEASSLPGGPVDSPVGVAPVVAPAAPEPANGPLTIRGIVRDTPDGQGLPGATVLVKGTAQGTSTNADGEFVLTLPATTAAVLQLSFIGYATTEVPVCGPAGETVTVQVQLREEVLGGLLISTGPPAPWHPRALLGWARYWLGRPFRR